MPFTSQELSDAGKIAIDFHMKNNPIDQIATERPLLAKLMGSKRSFPGAKQFLTEQLRQSYGSNFQWFYGTQSVTYNRRQTVEQAQYAWRGAHDGFYLDEDRLTENGIVLTDDKKGGNATGAEKVQLTNLLQEQTEVLRLGFEEKFDYDLHLDGTQSAESLAGLDHLISTTPSVGVVGGIDRATNVWWRNNVALGVAQANLIDQMEILWRACVRNGGRPDFILVGSTFLDTFRAAAQADIQRYLSNGNQAKLDPSISDLSFKGVPLVWDPVFADIDAAGAPATPWEKRCYFINTKHIRIRPAEGHDMISRKPPRAYNQYVHYWGLTWKGALSMNRSNSHAVMSVA